MAIDHINQQVGQNKAAQDSGQFTGNHHEGRFPEYHFADLAKVGADRKQGVQLA